MDKYKNEWSIEIGDYDREAREVEINTCIYRMPDHFAGLTHAILLLVDAVKEKNTNYDNIESIATSLEEILALMPERRG